MLFLNGSGSTLASVSPLIEILTGRFDLLAHDQRGLGRSANRRVPTPWPSTRRTRWGSSTSWGGQRAAYSASASVAWWRRSWRSPPPHRVERLALLCTSAGGGGGSSFPLHELADLSPSQRAETSVRLLDTRFSGEWLAAHPGDQALVDARAQRSGTPLSDEGRHGEFEQLQARRHHDVWERLGHIACPTLVAAGRFDGIAPVANSEAIVASIAGAELRVYEGGHIFIAQDRRALPDVLDFLSS